LNSEKQDAEEASLLNKGYF